MDIALPVVAGDNVTIDKSATGEQIVIKASSGGVPTIKAGTGVFSEIFNYDPSNPNTADGKNAHAEGKKNKATGNFSHAEGSSNESSGICSHSEGYGNITSGVYAHSEGFTNTATDWCAHAEGFFTNATNMYSHSEGQYNINPMPTNLIHATGIGVSKSDRRDGFEVYKTGEVWCKGPLYVGGNGYTLDKTTSKEVATKDNIKLYQHTYTFEAGTGNYVYCTTYKNSNTPMTVAEVINFFKSDPSVGKVVNVCVVNNDTTVGSGYFFDAGEGIDYTVIVLNSSANFIINADTNMTPKIIEL